MTDRKTGFSLIEVVLAVAIMGLTIVAVIGLMGTTSRAISDVRDTTSAARISELLQAEIERIGFNTLTNASTANDRFFLYATPTGDHVVLANPTPNNYADNFDPSDPLGPPPNADWPRGIAPRDRYYRIVITRMRNGSTPTNPNNHLHFNGTSVANPGSVTLSVQVEWPYNVPRGPGPNDAVQLDPNVNWNTPTPSPNAKVAYFHMAIRP